MVCLLSELNPIISYLRLTVSGNRIDFLVDFLANLFPPFKQVMALLMSFTHASLSSRWVAWKKWSCFFSVVTLKTNCSENKNTVTKTRFWS